MNRKTWRSLRAPSTSSTMKLSFSSCRCCAVEWGLELGQWASGGEGGASEPQPPTVRPTLQRSPCLSKHTHYAFLFVQQSFLGAWPAEEGECTELEGWGRGTLQLCQSSAGKMMAGNP